MPSQSESAEVLPTHSQVAIKLKLAAVLAERRPLVAHLHRSGADEMAGYSGPDELSFEHVVACAILEAGLGPADAQADRMALLASLDTEWTAAELLELEGHTLNPNCNASFTRVVAPELVADQRAGRIAPAQLTSGAWSLAEDLGRSLRSGTPALPVAGCGLRGGLLALFVAPLFMVVGLPVGLCASLLTDWCRTASAPPPRRRHLHPLPLLSRLVQVAGRGHIPRPRPVCRGHLPRRLHGASPRGRRRGGPLC